MKNGLYIVDYKGSWPYETALFMDGVWYLAYDGQGYPYVDRAPEGVEIHVKRKVEEAPPQCL